MPMSINNSFLIEKAIDYAKLAQLAYAKWNNGVLVAGQPDYDDYLKLWRELSPANKGYTFVTQYSDPATGYYGVIFQDSSGKKILANRGTTPSDLGDLAADKAILLSEAPSAQFVSMVRFITNNGLNAAQFDVTGHSLGGCLAQMAAAAYGTVGDVYTFNAPGAKNLMQTYELVGDAINPSNVVVKHWVEDINNPCTGSWITTEWRREAWNRYNTYITDL
ncbi:MAG: hypothetical protein HGB33_05305 [Syntrophaceae bacterium]|nr:hypothetical protein [Syntrophaceae bacterium]